MIFNALYPYKKATLLLKIFFVTIHKIEIWNYDFYTFESIKDNFWEGQIINILTSIETSYICDEFIKYVAQTITENPILI